MKFKPFTLISWIIIILGFYCYTNYSNFEKRIIIEMQREIKIEKGDTLNGLGEKLGLTSFTDKYIYKFYIRFNAPENFKLQAGDYIIRTNSTIENVFEALGKPITNDEKIMILEGWNIYDIDNYLFSQKDLIKSGEFIEKVEEFDEKLKEKYSFLENAKTLEGFLYPDSYDINPNNFTTEILINKMLSTFNTKVYISYLENYDSKKIVEIINLASIVEKEANSRDNPEEVAIIAGILKKRVDENWAVGADATACYPYKITHRECTPSFIKQHINDTNAYNLRKNTGLPPTPIGNPSAKTIKATVFSTKTPHYFYLHDSDGKIHYAVTNAEHEVNKANYID